MSEAETPKKPRAKRKTSGDAPAVAKPVRRKAQARRAPPPPETESQAMPSQSTAIAVTPAEPMDPADEQVVERAEHVSRGAGWALITAGIVGLVVPGVLGTPFLILGGMALWPGNRKRIERWRQGHSPKAFHGAMKQINRFLDDLDRRYPRKGP